MTIGTKMATSEGLRSRKARQTRERIAAAALKLFLERGFEHTTLDAIAEAADISRRTFFHYFSSKEAILDAVEDGVHEIFRAELAAAENLPPIIAVKEALLRMVGRYESDEALAIDRLMHATEGLRARKQANYERQEKALFSALSEKWPDPIRRPALRAVAMVSIGAMRIATERWRENPAEQPLAACLEQVFACLTDEIRVEARI